MIRVFADNGSQRGKKQMTTSFDRVTYSQLLLELQPKVITAEAE
jgi:hypothetical protein